MRLTGKQLDEMIANAGWIPGEGTRRLAKDFFDAGAAKRGEALKRLQDRYNPAGWRRDYQAAVARFKKAEAENSKLRRALKSIDDTAKGWPAAGTTCGDIARNALRDAGEA